MIDRGFSGTYYCKSNLLNDFIILVSLSPDHKSITCYRGMKYGGIDVKYKIFDVRKRMK